MTTRARLAVALFIGLTTYGYLRLSKRMDDRFDLLTRARVSHLRTYHDVDRLAESRRAD